MPVALDQPPGLHRLFHAATGPRPARIERRRVRGRPVVGLQADEPHTRLARDEAGEVQRRCSRCNPGASEVQVHGQVHVDAGETSGGFAQVADVPLGFDDEDGVWCDPGQFQRAVDLRGADHRGRDQQPPDAVRRKHLRLAQAGRAGADGARGDQAAGDFRAFVRLAVGPERLAPVAQVARHAGHVRFEPVQVEQQGRGGHIVAEPHGRGHASTTSGGRHGP